MMREAFKSKIQLLLALLIMVAAGELYAAQRVDKKQCVGILKALKSQFAGELKSLDREIVALVQFNPDDESSSLRTRENELLLKKKRRTELSLKVEFLDQMIYQFDRYYSGQPLRPFVMTRISDMLAREFGVGSTKLDPRDNMIKYLTRIRYGLGKSNASGPKVFDYLEGQLRVSSISNPEDADSFVNSESYSNGIDREKAVGLSLEEAGDYVDRLQKEKKVITENEVPADITNVEKLEPTRNKPATDAKESKSEWVEPRSPESSERVDFIPDEAFTRKHLLDSQRAYWKKALRERASAVSRDQQL